MPLIETNDTAVTMPIQIVLLEHDDVDGLYPFSATHCAWELRIGAFTIAERWARSLQGSTVAFISHRARHLASFVERYRHTSSYLQVPTLFISGNVLVSPTVMKQVAAACSESSSPILFYCAGHPVGTFLPTPAAEASGVSAAIDSLDPDSVLSIEIMGHAIHRLWHVFDHIERAIGWDSELITSDLASSASVHPTAVIDSSRGPVIVMEGAEVGAFSYVAGPTVIGPDAKVKPHSSIRHSVIGPASRVGGEISESIIHAYSNKQHDGFLGHSYLCEWVNLGAGTTTSNLKNTYGTVRVHMPWGDEDSQRTFLGSLIGDHSKSAIGTLFSTGTICGISSNVVSSDLAPKSIPSFSWLTSGERESYDVDKALTVAATVMSRRDVVLGPATADLLRSLHSDNDA